MIDPHDSAAVIVAARHIEGWMEPDELQWLYQTAATLPHPEPGWVEVGSWHGRSAFVVGCGLPANAIFYSVDNFDVSTTGMNPDEVCPCHGWVRDRLMATLNGMRRIRFDVNFTLMEGDSTTVVDVLMADHQKQLSAVFIDAAHDEESVRSDLAVWLPCIRRDGGIIAGHDYSAEHWPGVVRAVRGVFGDLGLLEEFDRQNPMTPRKLPGSLWVFRFGGQNETVA